MRRFAGVVLSLVLCAAAEAMVLETGSTVALTSYSNHGLYGGQGYLALSQGQAVWVDNRTGFWGVYGCDLIEPNYIPTLFVDGENYQDIYSISQLRISPPNALFLASTYSGDSLMFARGSDNYVNIFPIAGTDKGAKFDISGNWIVYSGWDPCTEPVSQAIFAVNFSDPCNVKSYVVYHYQPYEYQENKIVLKNNKIYYASSINDWENGIYHGLFNSIDISDPCDPQVVSTILPYNSYIYNFDVSDNWLVATGNFEEFYGIMAFSNFTDADAMNWNPIVVSEGECVAGPVVSGNTVVWATGGGTAPQSPALYQMQTQQPSGQMIMGAYLMPDTANTSVLYTLNSDNAAVDDLKIESDNLVWKEFDYGTDPSLSNIFAAKVSLTCGDMGYKLGDIDKNCRVDFQDFAMMAQDWLSCTDPHGCE